ncbi:caspase domain-containing protein [Lactarius hatsudake]|nr:caspase domain-containing protein [Lactarius hatsudake]
MSLIRGAFYRPPPGPPPASFPQGPQPDVYRSRDSLPRYMPVVQHPGYQHPPGHSSRPPSHIPVPPTYPINGHTSADSQALGPILPQPRTVYDHTLSPPSAFPHPFPNSDTRTPDRTHLPSDPGSGFSTPGRSGVPEPSYPPVPSYGERPPYGAVSSHPSGRSRVPDYNISPNNHASRNPPSWPSHTPAQPPPPPQRDVNLGHQAHRHHAPPTLHSSRIGQKKAVLVGIDYSGHRDSGFRLKWGIHDAHEMARFLHRYFGFEWNNIRILTDDRYDRPWNLPTEANIREAMTWLVENAQPVSGHATQVKDMNGDEPDGFDECMCTMDFTGNGQFPISSSTPGIIVDDDMHDIMVRPLPRGCRLTAILDCCHSGTLLDLPFIYDSRGTPKPTDPILVQRKSSKADVISLSACKDSERAFEAREGGALRRAFIEYMTNPGSGRTYYEIARNLRAYMNANDFRQRPQLSSCRPIDVNQPFII